MQPHTNNPGYVRILATIAVATLGVFVAACESESSGDAVARSTNDASSNETAALALERHAQRLWQARVTDDWAAVFAYDSSSEREGVTAAQYAAWAATGEPFRVHAFEIKNILVEDAMGWVEVSSSVSMRKYPTIAPRDANRWEKWRRVDDERHQVSAWRPVGPTMQDQYPATPLLRDRAAESELRARFEAAWSLRLNKDWAAFYEVSDPEDRALVPFEKFKAVQEMTGVISHELEWVEVLNTTAVGGEAGAAADAGTVRVTVTYKLNDPSLTKLAPKVDAVNERWVKRDGVWYLDLGGSGVPDGDVSALESPSESAQ